MGTFFRLHSEHMSTTHQISPRIRPLPYSPTILKPSAQRRQDGPCFGATLASERRRPAMGGTFRHFLTNIFQVQDSISERIASALSMKVTEDEHRRMVKRMAFKYALENHIAPRIIENILPDE